jgi:hypothetical protein
MPFSETVHLTGSEKVTITEAEWTHIYEQWIQKAVESFKTHKFVCSRSAASPGNFVKGIIRDLFEADIVIADLTGNRPNVYYELGVRHGLSTGTVMITQDWSAVPSDLKSYYTFRYSYSDQHHAYSKLYEEFEAQLHEKIQAIFDNLHASDNPVSDFLGSGNEYLKPQFEREKAELVFLSRLFREVSTGTRATCQTIAEFLRKGEVPRGVGASLDQFPFDLLLHRVVNTQWHVLPTDSLKTLYEAIIQIRSLYLPVFRAWDAFTINPADHTVKHLLALCRIASGKKQNNKKQDKALDKIVAGAEAVSYTIHYAPRSRKGSA